VAMSTSLTREELIELANHYSERVGQLNLKVAAQAALIGRLREELRAVLAQYVDADHREYEEPYWGARAESARALLAEREAS
jgi:hypothetical protein